tara:strand:- start:20988 stop:21449 length:462 start_codon:yes stop_codon:yes gene_type:complete
MEPLNSSERSDNSKNNSLRDESPNKDFWISDTFEEFLPKIQEKWPNIAIQTLEATKGSLDELIQVIADQSGKTSIGIRSQLNEIFDHTDNLNDVRDDFIDPIEDKLEDLINELNKTLRPKIERPIRERPILAITIAAGLGILIGSILNRGNQK